LKARIFLPPSNAWLKRQEFFWVVSSVSPKNGFVVMRPRIGIFDFKQEAIVKRLSFFRVGSRYLRVWLVVDDALSSVTWCGGHPVCGAFGNQIDDGADVVVENPMNGGWGCARVERFGEGDGFLEAEVFELLADLCGAAHGL
jgi:hypothetical protein